MTEKKEKSQVWGSRLSKSPDQLNIRFCAGRDVTPLPMADAVLLEYDIWTNLAHAEMLRKAGIYSDAEHQSVQDALRELFRLGRAGEFRLDPEKEDVHINIEHYLTYTKQIDAAKKIHSGRSRNDQVATDMRLYLRDEMIAAIDNLMTLISAIVSKAGEEIESIMPGFTHYQPAMLTTAGHWLTGWSQGILRDVTRMLATLGSINKCPLGAAASFGTSWPIDREYSAELLGFDSVEINTLDCISSRGEHEADIASDLSLMMNHLSIIAQDIILLSTPFYNMLKIDDRFVTGSSIMPQKRNPDFAEIIRSKAAFCHGTTVSLLGILKGSMSGYNRDSQQSKYLIMDLFRECGPAPLILASVCSSMIFNREQMLKHAKTGFMNSADVADWMAQRFKLPFRSCYEVLSLAVRYSEKQQQLTHDAMCRALKENELDITITKEEVDFLNSPDSLLKKKVHTGGPSIEATAEIIEAQKNEAKGIAADLQSIRKRVDSARDRCLGNQ